MRNQSVQFPKQHQSISLLAISISLIVTLASCNPDPTNTKLSTSQKTIAQDTTQKTTPIQSAPSNQPPTTADQQSTSLTAKSKEMADEMCKCLTPVVALSQKVKGMMDKDDKKGLEKIRPEYERLNAEAEKCGKNIEVKYGKIKNADQQKAVFENLSQTCPGVREMMNSVGGADQPPH
jgi:hypothetical protein